MANDIIRCPECSTEITLTDALTKEIGDGFKREFEERENKARAELKEKEATLEKRKLDFEENARAILDKERVKLKREAEERAKETLRGEFEELKEHSGDMKKKLAEAQSTELELRRAKRELEEKSESVELEMEKKLAEARSKIKSEARESLTEEYRIKDLEKTKVIEGLRKTIEDLKMKSEQGSQETQGTVFEDDLKKKLAKAFPEDEIEPVPKGIRGADAIERIGKRTGRDYGTIVWEMKNTKQWGGDWIEKLKDDRREIGADVAVIVSKTLPPGVEGFKEIDGVWVTGFLLAVPLGAILRTALIEISNTKLAAVGKGEKMELLYNYVTGTGFKQKVEALVGSFQSLKDDLDKEKRAMGKIWAKREKHLERVITNTVGLYGDIEGITGATLPEIEALELSDGLTDDD